MGQAFDGSIQGQAWVLLVYTQDLENAHVSIADVCRVAADWPD
jgi:hypothetical protein